MNAETARIRDRLSRRAVATEDSDESGSGLEAGGRWRWLLVGGLLLTALYVGLPYGLPAAGLYVATTFLAAAAVWLAVRQPGRLACRLAWLLLAGALALTTVGHLLWYWLDFLGLSPFPSVADAVYLAAYPLFMGALWTLGRDTGRGGDALLDALIVGVSACVLGWGVLIAPYVNESGLSPAQLFVGAAYPVADLILLPLILRLVFLHRARIHAHRFLLEGMILYLVADTLYAHGTVVGWYEPGGVTDGFWLAAYAFFAAAAWHPSAAIERPVQMAPVAQSAAHVVFLGAAAVVTPVVILLMAGTDVQLVRVAAVGSILLFILVMVRLSRLMGRVRRQSERLEALARTDPLTGAANRRSLDDELEREFARSERTGIPLCLAFLDFDHFKRYNDTYGHGAGDTLLQDAVTAWRSALRPTDVLARAGGEEFVVVFPHTDLEECREVVERLRELMPGRETCSAGIARFRRGDSPEALMHRADQALYAAKNGGRDRTVAEEGITQGA